jgi:hypothetical protein
MSFDKACTLTAVVGALAAVWTAGATAAVTLD